MLIKVLMEIVPSSVILYFIIVVKNNRKGLKYKKWNNIFATNFISNSLLFEVPVMNPAVCRSVDVRSFTGTLGRPVSHIICSV